MHLVLGVPELLDVLLSMHSVHGGGKGFLATLNVLTE